MKNKILIAFFVIGIGITLPGGLLSGNPILSVITYSLLSALILVGLVFGLLSFLENKVPEFIDFLNSSGVDSFEDDSSSKDSTDSGSNGDDSTTSGESPLSQSNSGSENKSSPGATSTLNNSEKENKNEKPRNGKFGDHIMVDNIPIKNEPKLMAEAIRTIMAQDDMPAAQPQGKQK